MTESNPYWICDKCRKYQQDQLKYCQVTHDMMILCHCPDEEEVSRLDGINNESAIQFVSQVIDTPDML